MNKVIIYADIESILDLRQGFLAYKGKSFEEISNYLQSEEYNSRDTDDLMEFTGDEYREEVNKGNIALIENSIITNVPASMVSKVLNVGVKTAIDGVRYVPEVWLNVHPFTFDEAGLYMLRECVFSILGGDCFVNIVDLELKELSPSFIKEVGIETCFIYNFSEWTDLHMEQLPKVNILEVDFVFPPIYRRRPEDSELEVIKEQGFEDGFTYFEFFFATFARFTFLPIPFYSNYVISKQIIEEFEKMWTEEQSKKTKEYEDEVEEYLHEHFSGKY